MEFKTQNGLNIKYKFKKMIQKIALGLLIVTLSTSCVSKKIYTDLEKKYADLKRDYRSIEDENADLLKSRKQLELDREALTAELERIKSERNKWQSDFDAATKKQDALQDAYAALEKNSNEALKANLAKNRELLEQLEAKEKTLALEQERLNASSKRLNELEALIVAKEANMRKLKETLSNALNGFEGKGLTVEQKNGKVYVSMENKLLFKSGSWAVNTDGKEAVIEVGKVLGDNPDISVLIEGHTDDDPFGGSGPIADNWDLSTKRATAIVAILSENKKVNKQNLTAAGRGEFSPLMSNTTTEGKAKNRRIEIILTPRLDAIADMLKDIN